MATTKKTTAKATKSIASKKAATTTKASTVSKKAAPTKSSNTKAAPTKSSNTKAAPVKKAVPAKKAAPAKKTAPAKKAAPAKKVVPAKKVAPAKKALVKKAVSPKKATTSKTVVAKVAAKKAVKAVPKKAVKAAQPITKVKVAPKAVVKEKVNKKEAKVVTPAKEKVSKKTTAKSVSDKKTASPATINKIRKSIVNNSSGTPVHPTKPSPAPMGRSLREEKKAQVIVAHRRLQNETTKAAPAKTSFNEFNRSLLENTVEPGTVAKRYSDDELNEFKEIINARLETARQELSYLQGLIMRKDGAGTEDSDNRFNAEDGSGAMERETVSQLAARQIQFISNLEKALVRIENKTYGVCRVTGKLIDKARLKAVPHATLSIEAKTTMRKH